MYLAHYLYSFKNIIKVLRFLCGVFEAGCSYGIDSKFIPCDFLNLARNIFLLF